MLESTIVYGLLTIIMVICGCIASRRQLAYDRKFVTLKSREKELSFAYLEIWLPILLFTFVFGCRYDVGIDQLTYLKWYNGEMPDSKEFLWRHIAELLSSCGVHYAVYFGIWAFLQVFFLYYTIKNYRFLFPYVAFYLIVGNFFLSMMNTIRFSLVASVFFYATKYITNRQFVKYCLCILVSTLIHKTSIVLLVFYPIFAYKTKWFNIKCQVLLLAVALFLWVNKELALNLLAYVFDFFIDKFNYNSGYRYAFHGKLGTNIFNQSAKFGRNTGLGDYVFLFRGIVVMIYYNKMRKKYKSALFDMSYTLWFVDFVAGFIVGKSYVISRPLLYLAPFKMLTLAYFTHYCFSSKKLQEQFMGVLFILIHFALFINIVSMGEANKSAFTFFWQH